MSLIEGGSIGRSPSKGVVLESGQLQKPRKLKTPFYATGVAALALVADVLLTGGAGGCGAVAGKMGSEAKGAGQAAGKVGGAAGKAGGEIMKESGQGIAKSSQCGFIHCDGSPTKPVTGGNPDSFKSVLEDSSNNFKEVLVDPNNGSADVQVYELGRCSAVQLQETGVNPIRWDAVSFLHGKNFVKVTGSPTAKDVYNADKNVQC